MPNSMTTYIVQVLGGHIVATTNLEAHEARLREQHAAHKWPEVHVITPAYEGCETLEDVLVKRKMGREVEYYEMEECKSA